MLGGVDGLTWPVWLPWFLLGLLLSEKAPLEYLAKHPSKKKVIIVRSSLK